MPDSPLSPHSASPGELQARIAAERDGVPFLVYRDGGAQHIERLDGDRLTVGRDPQSDIALSFDAEVSRAHAELVRVGPRWALVDDGLSRNGSFVNGERVTGRRPLADGDVLRFGNTVIGFRDPVAAAGSTVVAGGAIDASTLSATQREILKALCRPLLSNDRFAAPASNQQIADSLFLSVEAVKKQLRALFRKFEIDHLPQNQKRAALAELALHAGLVSPRDLD